MWSAIQIRGCGEVCGGVVVRRCVGGGVCEEVGVGRWVWGGGCGEVGVVRWVWGGGYGCGEVVWCGELGVGS